LNTKGNEHIEHAAKVLNALVCTEVELENVLGVKRSFFTVPEYPILPGNTAIQAEQDALNLRFALGFGDISGLDLLKIVDMQLGIRIYYRQLHSSISGLFAFDESVGACMLLNSSHPFVRQNHTAAHELGHYVSSRSQPEALVENALSETRSERYAGCFARGFLMPKDLVKRAFLSLTAGQSHFTRRHVILLADIFQVSREAVVRRLEELSIIKKGTWDWFLINGGITDDQAKNVLQTETNAISEENSTKNLVPERLKLLIRESAKRDLYSEGQLARMLWLDRQSVRALLDDLESETSIDDKFRIS
jgi:Zn-dependent peptidase ImmA (M78 family)